MSRSHILGASGAMYRVNPNRMHAQAYRPARRLNVFRRVLRAIFGVS